MRKVFRKTLQRITVMGSLFVYVFALVFAPVWHVHHSNCNNQSEHISECCSASLVYSSVEPHGECDLCHFLHVAVPLFVFAIVLPETANNLSELVAKTATSIVQTVYGVPSCRAPPFGVCV
ncbi:MAG: hypothetical protein LBK82_09835 [Planctomycetaceae bacterium]|jgi:hypothetical protein|nr:hypothetical protein [Planctomycetaceae bacterium]